MINTRQILSLFLTSHSKKKSAESLIDHLYESKGNGLKDGIEAALSAYLDGLPNKDDLRITIKAEGDQFSFESVKTKEENAGFFTNWEDLRRGADPSDEIGISVFIKKKPQHINAFFIYDIDAFLTNILSLTSIQLIQAFSDVFQKTGSDVYFVWNDEQYHFETRHIRFAKTLQEIVTDPDDKFDRRKLWEKLKGICHVSGIENCIALPEDFEIIKLGTLTAQAQQRFKECMLIMSLAVLCDLTTAGNNELLLKLNGYKSFEIRKALTSLDTSDLDEYYRIYNWLVAGGGIQDKTGLARNLISLNLGDAPAYKIAGTAYNSIQSGYKVYERQNIKQYIELRNKMADQIISFNEKATKIVEGFAGSFQKSMLAVVSLYATLIISKVLSSSSIAGAFSLGATVISYVFLAISLVYFFISRGEVENDRQRLIDAYQRMKTRNEDLLEKEDIKLILRDDADHKADLEYMRAKMKWYRMFWIFLLCLFAVATLVLYVINLNS